MASSKQSQLERQIAKAQVKLNDLPGLTHSEPQDETNLERKRATIQAAVLRAQSLLVEIKRSD